MFSILLVLVGLLFSEAAMSIGMIGLTVNAVFNKNIGDLWKRFLRTPALLALTGVFVVYLLSGLYSENTDFFVNRLRMKLPFLLMPFAILSIPRFDKAIYYQLLYGFLLLVFVGCLYSIFLFLQNPVDIIERYKQGHVLPTPVMHIRFSLMVAFAIGIGWHLYKEQFFFRYRWERLLIACLSILLLTYLHVLAVRSGLIAFYGGVFYLLVRRIFIKKQYFAGVAALVLFSISVWLAVMYIPTLNNKYHYMRYSLQLFKENRNLEDLSDSYRLGSIYAGVELSRQHFWSGVGVGDIKDECDRYFAKRFPALVGEQLMPHNQYLFVFAAAGVFGFLYFLWATTYPLWYRKSYQQEIMVIFHIILLSSFLVEHTLETQVGTALYILFVLLGIRYQDEHKEKD